MGHGDPDMENAASPYWVGRHTPADEPPIFFKRVPLKERYAYLIFDPRFRLPLYETALHDSVLATTHYARASLKFTNVAETMALTEMLYQVAPMYHLNVRTLESIMPEILPHIEAFEKTHTYSYQYALEDFAFLTPERDVQRTRFGSLELIANFRATEVDVLGRRLPARSVVVTFTESGESFVYRNEALADHSGTRSVADLRRVLSDSDWQARKQAAEELALRGPEAVDALFDLIVVLEGDEEWQVRNAAISALAALGREAEPAVPALIGALEDEEWQVRKLAAYALAALGEQARPAIPQLIAALQDEEWQVCEPAALALGAIGADAKDAVPALQACLDDEEWRVSKAAKDALKKFGVRIEEGEQNMLDGHQGSMGPETTVRELVAFLGDSEWKIRKSAAIALTARGSEAEPAIPALIEALSDEEWQVRKPAAQALAAIGPASQPAIPALIEALKDEEWQVREPAALALGVIGPGAKDAVPALQACLDDEERQVSKAAKDALEKISGTPSVLTTYVRWVALLVAILIVALLGRRLIYKP
jgi:HEAT repeat protein